MGHRLGHVRLRRIAGPHAYAASANIIQSARESRSGQKLKRDKSSNEIKVLNEIKGQITVSSKNNKSAQSSVEMEQIRYRGDFGSATLQISTCRRG